MTAPRTEMPHHTVVERLIECSCGQTMPAHCYEKHREREPKEVGRWIADRALNAAKTRMR